MTFPATHPLLMTVLRHEQPSLGSSRHSPARTAVPLLCHVQLCQLQQEIGVVLFHVYSLGLAWPRPGWSLVLQSSSEHLISSKGPNPENCLEGSSKRYRGKPTRGTGSKTGEPSMDGKIMAYCLGCGAAWFDSHIT